MRRMLFTGLGIAMSASLLLSHHAARGAGAPPLTYNQVQQTGSHNSYESTEGRRESIFDQLEYHHVRSLEIDIHRFHAMSDAQIAAAVLTAGAAGAPIPVGGSDFDVYHEPFDTHAPTCSSLSACLREVRAFHDANPQHEPVSVFLEFKDTTWGLGHGPADLDADLAAALGSRVIFTPADFLAWCSAQGQHPATLQAAVRACGWPTLDTLRGRVLFVVMQTSDDTCTPVLPMKSCDATAATVFSYAGTDGDAVARTAFIAPNDLGLSRSHVIFVNMNSRTEAQLAGSACAQFTPGRCPPAAPRQVLESVSVRKAVADTLVTSGSNFGFDDARDAGNQHLASNETNVDTQPAFSTRQPLGWPFMAREPAVHPEVASFADDESVVRLAVTSGDLEGSSDSFAFAFMSNPTTTSTWTAIVSSAGDTGQEWSKGCLMARASLDPRSDYYAVCRPNGGSHSSLDDTRRARIQYRDAGHQGTGITEFNLNPVRSAVFVFLESYVDATSHKYCYRGRVSDAAVGGSSETASPVCFASPLALQGVAASSHGDPKIKFLYAGLGRSDNGGALQPIFAANLSRVTTIGSEASWVDFGNGAFPAP